MKKYEEELNRFRSISEKWKDVDIDALIAKEILGALPSMSLEQKVRLKCTLEDIIKK